MDNYLGTKLAEGGCAEVFTWLDGADKVVKLAKANTNLHALTAELRHSGIAWQLGLPVPRPYGLVEVGGRNGIVFERVSGETILERFDRSARAGVDGPRPGTDCLEAGTTARLLHQIHSQSADGLPAQRASIERDFRRAGYLADAEVDAVVALLAALPLRQQLCHGDPNPGNFLRSGDEVMVIDWNNATVGNPEADLAEYILMLRYAVLPSSMPAEAIRLFDAVRESAIQLFMDAYQRLSGIGWVEVEPWMAPIAARKLAADAISEREKTLLLEEIRRRL